MDWTRPIRAEKFSYEYAAGIQNQFDFCHGNDERNQVKPEASFDYIDIFRVFPLQEQDEPRGPGDMEGQRYRLEFFEKNTVLRLGIGFMLDQWLFTQATM